MLIRFDNADLTIFCLLEHDIRLEELMKFITGTRTIPPLGLPHKLKIYFKRECEKMTSCKCKVSTMTCDLTLHLPMHYKTQTDMVGVLVESVQLSRGFHLI